MTYSISHKENAIIIETVGSIDRIEDCIALNKSIKKLLDENRKDIILDLTETPWVTASFCGFLIAVSQAAKETGLLFAIAAPLHSDTYDMLKIANIDQIISIFPSPQACLSASIDHAK